MFQQLLAFLEYILTHLHGLLKILIPVLKDLLERLLVHLDHLLLIIEHLGRLVLLINHPVGLRRHLLIREWSGSRWRELGLRWQRTPELRVLGVVLRLRIGIEWAL